MHDETANLPVVHEPPTETRFFGKIKRAFARLPFVHDLLAAYYCALDPMTPAYVRGVLLGAIAYFVMPADMLPDYIVGIGFTDDASVLAAALAAVGSHVRPAHRVAARRRLRALRRRI